jgi:hypothetical protein
VGCVVEAECLECGNVFTLEHGGGFFFHLVRCDKCGRTKSISFDDLGELHLRYLKGLSGPCAIETSAKDGDIRNQVPLEPISEEEYNGRIRPIAGKCRCGGKYALEAPSAVQPKSGKARRQSCTTDE